MAKQWHVYTDTSVFGGVFDAEFCVVTQRFFDEVRAGRYVVCVSEITARELQDAPQDVRTFVAALPSEATRRLEFTPEMVSLRDAYLSARVVGKRFVDDAAHVAAATVSRADLIVSWNFRHLVKWEKIRAFNAVNLSLGYPVMTILSPRELIHDEEGL